MTFHSQTRKISAVGQRLTETVKANMWREFARLLTVTLGAFIAAFGYVLFQIPFNIAAGGLSGIALIVNNYTGFSVGLIFWVLNIPMLILGFYYLGGWKFLIHTLIASTLFAIFTDVLTIYLPQIIDPFPITDNMILNTIYGGIIGGLAGGIIYRSGSTMGGTGVIGRIVQKKTGMPLSQVYLFNESATLFALGLVFGWENALFGLMMLFINGLATDFALEGASSTRTATIVTDKPREVAAALREKLDRGASYWEITGGYTGAKHFMVMCTIYRSQMSEVRYAVRDVDPNAFITIGVSQQALGQGFSPLQSKSPNLSFKKGKG